MRMWFLEGCNLFVGDHDPNASKHLTLTELQLPTMEEMTADHHPGGSPFAIDVPVGYEKLEATFKLAGWDPDVLSMFGVGTRVAETFTAYGSLRDKLTGVSMQAKAVMTGRLGRAEPETFQRGELQGHDYAITSMIRYQLFLGGREKFYFDFATAAWRIDGKVQNADERRNLMLPTI